MSITEITEQIRVLSEELRRAGRYDLLLDAITVPALQQLNIEAAKERLYPLDFSSVFLSFCLFSDEKAARFTTNRFLCV